MVKRTLFYTIFSTKNNAAQYLGSVYVVLEESKSKSMCGPLFVLGSLKAWKDTMEMVTTLVWSLHSSYKRGGNVDVDLALLAMLDS